MTLREVADTRKCHITTVIRHEKATILKRHIIGSYARLYGVPSVEIFFEPTHG